MSATRKLNTYAQAIRAAEVVPVAELAAILRADDNPGVFPGPRRPYRIAMDVLVGDDTPFPFASFEYCDRRGYSKIGAVELQGHRVVVERGVDRAPAVYDNNVAVFEFEQADGSYRYVRAACRVTTMRDGVATKSEE